MIPELVTEPDKEEGEIRTPEMPFWGMRTRRAAEANEVGPEEFMPPEFITAVPTKTTLPEEETEPSLDTVPVVPAKVKLLLRKSELEMFKVEAMSPLRLLPGRMKLSLCPGGLRGRRSRWI